MKKKKCFWKKDIDCDFHNIIKTRDDNYPVCFIKNDSGKYTLCEHHPGCAWCEKSDFFEEKILRERIEPWLTSLFQSEHLSLLTGSGLTIGICDVAGTTATGMPQSEFENFKEKISQEVKRTASVLGRAEGNFEDYIRVANTLLEGLQIMGDDNAETLRKEIEDKIRLFTESLLKTEADLTCSPLKEKAFNCLIAFLMSFASRTGTKDRINIFTTNYDRLIEEAADLAGLHLLDRFVGKLSPVFRSSRLNMDLHYNPPGIRGEPRFLEGVAHFTKLHGSLDWLQIGDIIRRIGLPFGAQDVKPYLQAPGLEDASEFKLMIYPNQAKDKETSFYPYVELFRDFAAAVCRPNSTIITYGYSFGDEHINRVLRDMLTIPSTHLIIISYDDRLGRIHNFYDQTAHIDQITLMLGADVASIDILTQKYLPKSAIDFATARMSDILQRRWASNSSKKTKDSEEIMAAPLEDRGDEKC